MGASIVYGMGAGSSCGCFITYNGGVVAKVVACMPGFDMSIDSACADVSCAAGVISLVLMFIEVGDTLCSISQLFTMALITEDQHAAMVASYLPSHHLCLNEYQPCMNRCMLYLRTFFKWYLNT